MSGGRAGFCLQTVGATGGLRAPRWCLIRVDWRCEEPGAGTPIRGSSRPWPPTGLHLEGGGQRAAAGCPPSASEPGRPLRAERPGVLVAGGGASASPRARPCLPAPRGLGCPVRGLAEGEAQPAFVPGQGWRARPAWAPGAGSLAGRAGHGRARPGAGLRGSGSAVGCWDEGLTEAGREDGRLRTPHWAAATCPAWAEGPPDLPPAN